MSRILRLEPASQPQNLRAEPEKLERVTYRSTIEASPILGTTWAPGITPPPGSASYLNLLSVCSSAELHLGLDPICMVCDRYLYIL